MSNIDFKALPKANLHTHISGSMRLSTLAEFSGEDPQKIREQMDKRLGISLNSYLSVFDNLITPHLQTPERLERIAFEFIEDCHNDGVIYAETKVNPFGYVKGGLHPVDVIEAFAAGLRRGKKQYGVKNRIIIGIVRDSGNEMDAVKLALAKEGAVSGLDIMGPEDNFNLEAMRKAIDLARMNLIPITCHCGEGAGPESILEAVVFSGFDRIGHGTRIEENGKLVNRFNNKKIPIEICLTSNKNTGVVKDLKKHPFGNLWKLGLRVCLCTDNSLIDSVTLSSEFELAHKLFGLQLKDFRRMTLDALDEAFLQHAEKVPLKQTVKEYYNKIGYKDA